MCSSVETVYSIEGNTRVIVRADAHHVSEQVYYQTKLQEAEHMPYPLPRGTVSMHVRCVMSGTPCSAVWPTTSNRCTNQGLRSMSFCSSC